MSSDLRERVVRLETVVRHLAGTVNTLKTQADSTLEAVNELRTIVSTDHAVRQAEAAKDRRLMKGSVAALSALWIVAQALHLLVN